MECGDLSPLWFGAERRVVRAGPCGSAATESGDKSPHSTWRVVCAFEFAARASSYSVCAATSSGSRAVANPARLEARGKAESRLWNTPGAVGNDDADFDRDRGEDPQPTSGVNDCRRIT